MSSSTDSLKKKVCVTVFLDELFEEVNDEGHRGRKQVSEVTESEVKIGEQACKNPPEYDLDIHEKINISPNADTTQIQPEYRPRKHRRESKFSRNPYDSLKNELDKYGCGSDVKTNFKNSKPVGSTFSDSDFDEYLELDKRLSAGSKSSFSEFSESDLKEKNFVSANLVLSSMVVCSKQRRTGSSKMLDDQPNVISYCSRSTQFDGRKKDLQNIDDKIESDALLTDEQQKKMDDDLMWKKTRKQIQLILAKARSKYEEQLACERDQIKHYDLRSILEECEDSLEKKHSVDSFEIYSDLLSKASADFKESEIQNISDSYTCVFPHDTRGSQSRLLEVKKVWTNNDRNVWNDGFESDTSDPDCTTYTKRIDSIPLQEESSLCYALCVKCKENIFKRAENEIITNADNMKLGGSFKPVNLRSSLYNRELKTSKEFNSLQAPAEFSNMDRSEQKEVEVEKITAVEIAPIVNSEMPVERQIKNYAEGDTAEKTLKKGCKRNLTSKEDLFVGNEISIQVDERNMIHSENIFEGAEVALIVQTKTQKEQETGRQTHKNTGGIAEVFIKKKKFEMNIEKSMTDAESEMIFAESENFCENDDLLNYKFYFESAASYKIHSEPSGKGKDVCVIEIEDKHSRSKILRRIKTVEILGDTSTEVILMCENLSNNDLCLEAWKSNVSTLRSFTEMGQCYLKDSKDSSMYLIEIPLNFTHPKENKI